MLRRALFRARLSEEDVAAHLGVDPKTVRRWLEGRLPYPRHRQAVSRLVEADESDLWPEVHADRVARSLPEDIKAVYPHRWAVPHAVWHELFESAQHEIDVLAYSGLFLAEDVGLLDLFASKARTGVLVRIALGDPQRINVAGAGAEEFVVDAAVVRIRKALTLYSQLLIAGRVEIRLHHAVLYNSLYRADDDLLVNQRSYGFSAAGAPVIHLHRIGGAETFGSYIDSFERIWSRSSPAKSFNPMLSQ
jgi:transcriptional regulator with XRE-family HTH domain